MKTNIIAGRNRKFYSYLITRGGVFLLTALIILLSSCRQVPTIIVPPIERPSNKPDIWNGTVDRAWYSEHSEHSSTFVIDTAEGLAGLASIVNDGTDDFEGKTIRLSNSVDLAGIPWTPIGANGTPFKGTFDGGKNSIIGFKNDGIGIANDNEGDKDRFFTAFFTAVDGGSVKNVVFENYTIVPIEEITTEGADNNQRMSSVAVGNLMNGSIVQNVIVKEGTVNGPVRVAGIVARAAGGTQNSPNKIIGCENYANASSEITGGNTYGTAGGIISTTAGGSYTFISDVVNGGSMTGVDAGGIVGDNQGTLEINGARNLSGTTMSASLFGGGIIGCNYNNAYLVVRKAVNEGEVRSYGAEYNDNGGVLGEISIGGILGSEYISQGFEIYESKNTGTLSVLYEGGTGYASEADGNADGLSASIGGIVGSFGGGQSNPYSIIISDSSSSGVIYNDAVTINDNETTIKRRNRLTVGGIIGLGTADNVTITNSYGTDKYIYTGTGEDADTYIYASIAGLLHIENNLTVDFNSHIEFSRPFSLIRNTATEAKFTLKNMNIQDLVFGSYSDNTHDNKLNLSLPETNVQNLRHSWATDYGAYALAGNVVIEEAESIENLLVFADEYHSSFNTIWDISYTIPNDLTFNWSAGTLYDQNSTLTLNNTEIIFGNKNGLVSPVDKEIIGDYSEHEFNARKEYIIKGTYPLP